MRREAASAVLEFIATHLGWRAAFFVMGAFGLLLAFFYAIVVREPPAEAARLDDGRAEPAPPLLAILGQLFAKRTAVCGFVGFGFQSFVIFAMNAW